MRKANVQYNELVGSAAADQTGAAAGLQELAEKNGIDISRYVPVGVRIGGVPPKIRCIYAIDMGRKADWTLEQVIEHQRNQGDNARCKAFSITPADVDPYFTRLDVQLGLRDVPPPREDQFEETTLEELDWE